MTDYLERETDSDNDQPLLIEKLHTRACVVVPTFSRWPRSSSPASAEQSGVERSLDGRLEEAVGLAGAIDLEVCEQQIIKMSQPRPATLIGSGKVDELKAIVDQQGIGLVFVDHALTPVQQRNLERVWGTKVLDRTGLILEIFGARARTAEGRLQVEHAHLTYQKGRLVRSWTHLERQRGGFGFLGGPGETQIEADRRLIQDRLDKIERDLEKVKRTRELHRKNRKKVPHPIVALVGYTNAGKSTLFNRLTNAEVLAKDQLFATLDPTMRRIRLPHGSEVILSDTVGFISDLPTHLVAAFRATLEEVIAADLILHVRDCSHADSEPQADDVARTLDLLGVDSSDPERMIEVLNKVDLLSVDAEAVVNSRAAINGRAAGAISAITGQGVDHLLQLIENKLHHKRAWFDLSLPITDGALVAWVHRTLEVLSREDLDDQILMSVRVPEAALDQFHHLAGAYIRSPAAVG